MKFAYIIFLVLHFLSIHLEAQIKSISPVRSQAPLIDGVFQDSEWQHGACATDFIQTEPEEGKPASQRTEAYFLYDDNYLYVGIKCFDNETDKIQSEVTGRDDLGTSDFIELIFDTFHDHRNAYSFITTPAGTKIDYRYFNDGRSDDVGWNGVWWVESGITDYGWITEFKIPFSTLKFDETNDTWGLNLNRWIRRNNETVFWQHQTRDDVFKISKNGHLTGLVGIKGGLNLEVLPYVTTQVKDSRISEFEFKNENGVTGLDIKYGVAENLNLVLTVNPDFAQIEADEDQINLTRYPLYFPEKRPFFTEGASIFNTAGNNPGTSLFYSRRINEPVYGLKMTGKIGTWDVGLLHAMNDNDLGIVSNIEDGLVSDDTRKESFYNIIRISKDILNHSQIGLIAMSKEYSGNYNRLFGLDTKLRLSNNFYLNLEAVKSFNSIVGNNSHSLSTVFYRFADLVSFALRYDEKGTDYMGNDIGFNDYSDLRRFNGWFQIAPRFEEIGIRKVWFRTSFFTENFWGNDYFDESKLYRTLGQKITVQTNNYYILNFETEQGKEFDRYDTTLYPVGSYSVSAGSNQNRKLWGSISHTQGKYRLGYSWTYSGSTRFNPTTNFKLELAYSHTHVNLPNAETAIQESSDYEIWRTKLYYSLNRDLNFRVILQYNRAESRLDTYFLVAYNFMPKSFIYLAYNQMLDKKSYINGTGQLIHPEFSSAYKLLQLKFSYLLSY